jgi:glycosyltransferase involved in cell wall biosynthesis
MKLNILVSTIDNGIESVPNLVLPQDPFVSYIVSHQYTDEKYLKFPEKLIREDIKVSHIKGKGVTKSRNNAIKLSDADIGLFSDDDVTYEPEWLENVRTKFEKNPGLDVALFKIKTFEGEPEYRDYPGEIIEYKKAPSVGTIQMAVRLKKVKENNIYFDERFGAGNPYLIGSDEQIFVHDCLKKGLKVTYFPEYIVRHKYESTVKFISPYDSKICRVIGGLDARMNGWIAIPKAFFGTIKFLPELISNKKNPLLYFKDRFAAACYILLTKG